MSTQDGSIAISSAAQTNRAFNVRAKTAVGADAGFIVIITKEMN